jgi:hypothetical protein
MYNGWPNEDQVRVNLTNPNGAVNSGSFDINLEREPHRVPAKVQTLLTRFGWTTSETCPNTKEVLFQKDPPNDAPDNVKSAWDSDLQNCHWRWYEAMAYEFGKFMSIGDDADWNKSQGSGVGSANQASPPQS